MISHKRYITLLLEKLYFIEYVLQWPRKGFGVIFLFGIAAFSFHSLSDNQNIGFFLLFWMANILHIYIFNFLDDRSLFLTSILLYFIFGNENKQNKPRERKKIKLQICCYFNFDCFLHDSSSAVRWSRLLWILSYFCFVLFS